ncbi:protein PTST homolog 3, chloroplastic isoform X3 [Abrus precatorius]|uniref:Protein PTST homolog 3, chloroplastic isoform X3 n=1 Tax=Abrus precatorius TaxID=3816 RepID=A0A8B8M608_ABRPR|nr:protein PTST homolog 3, chloroplastic isoform X3 [Abrus precatorius]
MSTVWVCYFPSCTTLACSACKLSPTHLLHPSSISTQFQLRASQTSTTRTRTRRSRRTKSDAEICNDIREFLTSVGLPEDHIPSTKELLLHGWNDLANIVRRRGHKQIHELLTASSLRVDIDSLTGQNEKVDSLVNHAEAVNNDFDSSREGLYPNFDGRSSMPTEISGESSFEAMCAVNSEFEDSLAGKVVGKNEITLPLAVPSVENCSSASSNDSDIDSGDEDLEPLIDLSLEQKDLPALEGLDDGNENVVEDVPVTSEAFVRENFAGEYRIDSVVHSADSSSMNLDTSANLSLKDKVANFIQNGDLDPVEDHVSGISNGDDGQESEEYIESEPAVNMPQGAHPSEDNNFIALHGNSLTYKDDHMQREDLTTHFDKDMVAEAPKVQNESEINHLKFMLYQKELELSRLKEQIEKEKLALSVLQTKAEAEISKARKLIYEKDAELHIAEESLSGLKEVEIEFCGDGDVVEVAGSFNGWHHQIKMDPQLSTSAIEVGESRSWSTMLWLYPGVYEIKFVVDGQWSTDPQRETVTRGHICNNILRVDR